MTNGTTTSTTTSTDDERRQRLESLRSAVNDFADREIERLGKEKDFLTSVVDGRTSSGQLAGDNSERASVLAQEEINAFLEG
jgi:hypothetical protein